MLASMRLHDTRFRQVRGAWSPLRHRMSQAPTGQTMRVPGSSVDGAVTSGPAKKARAVSLELVGPPLPRVPSGFEGQVASAGVAGLSASVAGACGRSAGSQLRQRGAAEMIGLWIRGILAYLRSFGPLGDCRHSVADQCCCRRGRHQVSSHCILVLGVIEKAIALAECVRDLPPRWMDVVGGTHVLQALCDWPGTLLAASRALGVL